MKSMSPTLDWRFGANFVPSSAANQLAMWQAESFDLATIDRELGWAANIGMSVMRVYLHDLLYEQDAAGFPARIEQYLSVAERHGIKTIFVFFDDCWRSEFSLGRQPEPQPYHHNELWVQSPGNRAADDLSQWPRLEQYVKAILERFGRDPRILLWDLYNEPGNGVDGNHLDSRRLRGQASLPLLKAIFRWAHEAAPTQPLTAGIWRISEEFDELNRYCLEHSDVVSFHDYDGPERLEERCDFLRFLAQGRPLICTEYMARTAGSTFEACLPILRRRHIPAVNWGLVSGKTQTIYPWGWSEAKGEPTRYFHDVFRPDGQLLYPEERAVFEAVCAEK